MAGLHPEGSVASRRRRPPHYRQMKSFPDFREMNQKRMTGYMAVLSIFKKGYCHECSYCQVSAARIGIIG
jgi:hypothetical protein